MFFIEILLNFMLITPLLNFSVPVILSFAWHRRTKGHRSKTIDYEGAKIRAPEVLTLWH